jgi:nicotinate dehydrogenase subunit B
MTSPGMPLPASEARREFLKAGGTLLVAFALPRSSCAIDAKGMAPKTVAPEEVDAFLAIDAQGRVTVYSGKVDLGTGIETAMAQIAAEELGVPLDRVSVVQGDTLLTPDQGITSGSLSIQNGGMQLRQAAATAREALLAQVSSRQGIARDALAVKDGVIVPQAGGEGWSYAQLVGGRDLQLTLDPKAPLKDPRHYTIVGTSVARRDIPDKVTGRFLYMQDFRLENMVHARVVLPHAIKAKLLSWNDDRARAIPGYLRTIVRGNHLAVLARSEWAAIRASRAIDAQWSSWEGLPDQARLWEYLRTVKIARDEDLQKTGNSAEAMKTGGARRLAATYDFAVHTHGSIGPSCAVAQFRDGRLTVWSASQATHNLRGQLARMMDLKPENVRCIYIEGSGCYGRNGHEDAAADAALLAREMQVPVRVQWMREDEHGWDPKGPPVLHDMRAALDARGEVLAWESEVYIPERPKSRNVKLLAAELADLPHEDANPGNLHQGMAIPYTMPNVRATAHWLSDTPLRVSWIRTPGRMQNTFANECFLDELAAAAGADPLAFRLARLDDPRGAELLQRLGVVSSWAPRRAPRDAGPIARGRGLAYIRYDLARTYVAAVAEVEVDRGTGRVRASRFFVVQDCGQVINPDGVRNQIEGNIVQTTSRTLLEEIRFDRSRVTSVDWKSYPILRFSDVPEVLVELIDRPTQPPWGAGEPSAAVVPAAIANAVFDATGARLRSVPLRPAKVLAALKEI